MSVVDDYLAGCSDRDAAALQHVREVVLDELPEVCEVVSHNLSAFAVVEDGAQRVVGGFAAGRRFLSWYPFSGAVLYELADELVGFERTKGSLHFTAERMLPDETVRALLRARLAEIAARGR